MDHFIFETKHANRLFFPLWRLGATAVSVCCGTSDAMKRARPLVTEMAASLVPCGRGQRWPCSTPRWPTLSLSKQDSVVRFLILRLWIYDRLLCTLK